MIKSVLLGCMLFNSPLFFSFFESNLSLNFKKILISLFKFLSGFSSSLLSLKIAHSFSFKLFLDLSLYKFALKLFFFHLLNVIQFEILKLALDVLSILHLFVILLLKFFPQTLIILKHILAKGRFGTCTFWPRYLGTCAKMPQFHNVLAEISMVPKNTHAEMFLYWNVIVQ